MRAALLCCTVLLLASSTHASFIDDIIANIDGLFTHYEEAPFTTTSSNTEYEERQYPAKKWVCTRSTVQGVGDDMGPLFWRLFQYISGNNVGNVSIPMTVPVATEVTFLEDTTTKQYEMCFFINEAHQTNSPNPADPAVFLLDRPATTVLTRRVGGYLRTESAWMQEAGRLAVVLQEHGKTVNLSHTFWAGYDAPFKFWNRRNEVWFPVTQAA